MASMNKNGQTADSSSNGKKSKQDTGPAHAKHPKKKAKGHREKEAVAKPNGNETDPKVEAKPRVKVKKPKVVRDSFTMPESEYAQIAELKEACLALGVAVKKSELLRAGIAALGRLPAEDLKQAVQQVESIKTGRPARKSKGEKSKPKT